MSSGNWIVDNLNNALDTWNDKMTEIWQLIKDRHQSFVEGNDATLYGINRGVKYAELLTDVKLIIHILPKNDDELDIIFNGLNNPSIFPSLGRHEDILRIDSIKIVELEKSESGIAPENDMYVPINQLDKDENPNLLGTIYKLNKVFSIDPKTKLRKWDKVVAAKHISKGNLLYSDQMYLDEDGKTLAFFA